MDIGKDLAKAFDYGYKQGKKDATQWISVKDRLPEKGGRYLTCDHKGNVHIFYHYDFYQFPFDIDEENTRFYMVTHWMPLPPKPQEGEW